MAIRQYNLKIKDGSDMYWDLPRRDISIPVESYKYITTRWNDKEYTWNRLSYMVYGNTKYYWLLLKVNGLIDPLSVKDGDLIRILLPKHLNEIEAD